MSAADLKVPLILGAGLGLAAFVVWRNLPALAGGAVKAADAVVGETVNSIGEVIGVPRTDIGQCAADKAAGRAWDASFSCPAGEFLGWLWNR